MPDESVNPLMPKTKKRKLTDNENSRVRQMKEEGFSIGQIARYFGVHKPRIKKALGLPYKNPRLAKKPWTGSVV